MRTQCSRNHRVTVLSPKLIWQQVNIVNFNKLLICFHVASGLKVNLQNSKVYGGGVEDNKIARLVDILKCWAYFPLVYLGLPVGDNMKLSRYWDPV
uniref:Uncharacterized protein n=1 Tax=Lactuca sativa TaxID=4236 RepID=A0A9R1XG43_LACSA|nr:hypothetical protein LSAT_V11C400207750 [Lactuca sativa]